MYHRLYYTHTMSLFLVRDCGLVPDIQNGQIDYSDGTNYTDQIVYSCDIGYDLIGYDVRTCQHTRMWSGEAPVCQSMTHVTSN